MLSNQRPQPNNSIPVITIDGPTATGKGTVGKLLADELGWHFLDSGVLYRILALAALQKNIAPNDTHALESLATNLQMEVLSEPRKLQCVTYLKRDVTDLIRQEKCGVYASQIAVLPEVRAALLPSYYSFRTAPGLVADGRDMGTVIFPNAILKVFLTATAEERAKRRWRQLQKKNISVSLRDVASGLDERDQRDSERAVAPLVPATDARIIDTTQLAVNEVLDILLLQAKQLL